MAYVTNFTTRQAGRKRWRELQVGRTGRAVDHSRGQDRRPCYISKLKEKPEQRTGIRLAGGWVGPLRNTAWQRIPTWRQGARMGRRIAVSKQFIGETNFRDAGQQGAGAGQNSGGKRTRRIRRCRRRVRHRTTTPIRPAPSFGRRADHGKRRTRRRLEIFKLSFERNGDQWAGCMSGWRGGLFGETETPSRHWSTRGKAN